MKWTDEQIVVAMEILAYIASIKTERKQKISLKAAYEEIGVSEELQLSRKEIEEISKDLIQWCSEE